MNPISPDFQEFLNHLTNNALMALRNADSIARGTGNPYVGTEHILLGILAQDSSVGSKILEGSGVTLTKARNILNTSTKPIPVYEAKGLSEVAKLTLRMAYEISKEYGQDFCGTEHILLSLLSQKNGRAIEILKEMDVDVAILLHEIEKIVARQNESGHGGVEILNKVKKSKNSILDSFGIDLTAQARAGKLDPVIGRETQIRRVVTILSRRTKNNPVLIGEPGVGKTAIVEGLASRIVSEDVPSTLLDKKIYTLDLAGMIAGTKYRGEFEDRLKKLMKELESNKQVIIFIDELHLLVGAGAAEGAMDAANILKPALARGKIQLIGATTTSEYTKYIEKDGALERRLQPIQVPEATEEETVKILKGLKKHYESFHNVKISDEVLEDTARFATRYIRDRFLPDKAIDLLDEAAAHLRVDKAKTSPELRKAQKDLQILQIKIEDAAAAEDYKLAADYKTEASKLAQKLSDMQIDQKNEEKLALSSDDVAKVVARITGIPVNNVIKSEAKHLLNLEKELSKQVVGQSEAIEAIAKAVRRSRSGVSDAKRPSGSFIFLGPTGVGKTELAKVLAREFFGSENNLIKIDMSEFGEKHTSSRLVGATAGYVGYDDGGQLTDKVRRQPYSLVLFDEIEKAHPDVFNLLLQILEDGQLTDGKGRIIDFSNTIIIMTSNIGAEKLQKESKLGFEVKTKRDANNLDDLHEKNKQSVLETLQKMMRPELLNRVDKMIVFHSLTKVEIRSILDIQLSQISKRLIKSGLMINVSSSAKNFLVEKGYDVKNGVRPLRRVLQETIEEEVADGLLDGRYTPGTIIDVGLKSGKLVYSVGSEKK